MQKATLEEFKQEKILAREQVKKKAIKTLNALDPLALHLFGSGGRQEEDEFSDIDLFATFEDTEFDMVVKRRESVYAEIAPILVRLFQKKSNPAGWYHDLIIYDTKDGLVHADFYMTPKSMVVLPPHAVLISGEHISTKGEWSLPPEKNESGHDLYDGILAMGYIAIKGVVRKWDSGFFDWYKGLYDAYRRDENSSLPELPQQYDFKFIEAVFVNLKEEGTENQKKSNRKIYTYLTEVISLYS